MPFHLRTTAHPSSNITSSSSLISNLSSNSDIIVSSASVSSLIVTDSTIEHNSSNHRSGSKRNTSSTLSANKVGFFNIFDRPNSASANLNNKTQVYRLSSSDPTESKDSIGLFELLYNNKCIW